MKRRIAIDGRTRTSLVWAILSFAVMVATVSLLSVTGNAVSAEPALPAGFRDEVVLDGLTNPTNVEFSPDGRVFVAEKSGLIKVFDDLSDPTPTTFADLRTNVHNFWDRGLLGLALAPDFPSDPHVYVLYTHDAKIGGVAPRWGTKDVSSDPCPTPPGATQDGCVVSGRLSRLTASGDTMTGSEKVLLEGWCQQYPSHSVGDLAFGADGALYASGGDGASFSFADYGQEGRPVNPCGDPPGGAGDVLSPPTAEGGALRSQDLRTREDPVGLDGAILRLEPSNGAPFPGNPLIDDTHPNARRIVAYGLRNPFRFTTRPGTNEIWTGDVGWSKVEEINRVPDPTSRPVDNFGWPCYEGTGRQAGYDGDNLAICENLYSGQGAPATERYFSYRHGNQVVPGESCEPGNSSLAGMAFYGGDAYPGRYKDALFFADYSRKCIWAMEPGSNGLPNPAKVSTFVAGAASPVDLETGPNGDLFYVDLNGGTVHRITYSATNQPPVADAKATPTYGSTPLTVHFDGTGSTDPENNILTYEWDFTGDGTVDATDATPSYTYQDAGDLDAKLTVTDAEGASDTDDVEISPGNTPPVAKIERPLSTRTWKVGAEIPFSGSASDGQDGALSPAQLTWSLILHHCDSSGDCHNHGIQDFSGVADGAFVAPDHEYPSYLELRLTATDSGGLTSTSSVRLDPKTVQLRFASRPTGARLAVGSTGRRAPFTRTVILGSSNSVSAPSRFVSEGQDYRFHHWSDGGARTHNIVAPATDTTYRATFRPTRR
jgi:glucose/arabinose dehydrogenase